VKSVSFSFQDAGIVSWIADEDVVLSAVQAYMDCVVSQDPQLTFTAFTAAPTGYFSREQFAFLMYSPGAISSKENLSFQLSLGQKIFVASRAGPGLVTLFFQDSGDLLKQALGNL
jgi:hypothetical protein